jgi:RNA polymerase sigma-70 factor (ECF subfamily)
MEHIPSGSKKTESDETLVRVAQRQWGEPAGREAVSALVTRHQKAVYGWCYRYARNPEAALDLTQEVLIAVYEKLPTLREPARFSAWLFIIARNVCFKAMRQRRENVSADAVDLADDRYTADSDLLVIEREQKEILLGMIAILDPVEQDALWMRYIDGLSLSAIEDLLGIGSKSGARGVLQRAMRRLRARYGKHRRGGGSKEGLT